LKQAWKQPLPLQLPDLLLLVPLLLLLEQLLQHDLVDWQPLPAPQHHAEA
jgi:hypothetical protein